LSSASKALIVIMIIESMIIIGLTIERMVHPTTQNSEKYATLMLINSVFISAFAIDGVLNENIFELFAFVVVSIFTLLITVYQFVEQDVTTEVIVLWIRFIAVCIFIPINIVMSYVCYKNFGWIVYKKIGASVEITSMYSRYQQMLALLKLDLQFGINLVVMAGLFLFSDWEIWVDAGVMALTIIVLGITWGGLRQEKKWAVFIFFVFAPVEPVYIFYKFVHYANHPLDSTIYEPLVYVAGSVAVVNRLLLMIWVFLCRRNFDKNLKEVFTKEDEEENPLLGNFTDTIVNNIVA